jgi:type IV pilus assembly protein PilF
MNCKQLSSAIYSFFTLTLLIVFLSGCSTNTYSVHETHQENKEAAELNAKLGMSYLALHDNERAKQKILLAQKSNPHDPAVWYALAFYQEKTGDISFAEKSYLRAIALAPHTGAAHNNYGVFLCNQGKYSAAISQFLAAVRDPNYLHAANAYENAGLCALKIPDTQKANKFFKRALAENPNISSSKYATF